MNNAEKLAAIAELEQKLLESLDQYVLAIRNKESLRVKEALYDEVNKIKKEIKALRGK